MEIANLWNLFNTLMISYLVVAVLLLSRRQERHIEWHRTPDDEDMDTEDIGADRADN